MVEGLLGSGSRICGYDEGRNCVRASSLGGNLIAARRTSRPERDSKIPRFAFRLHEDPVGRWKVDNGG